MGTYSGVILDSKTEVPKDILKTTLGLIEQNWLLIKQNEEIIELLKNNSNTKNPSRLGLN